MKTVWKYFLEPKDDQHLELPAGAEVLHVGVQRGAVHVWALVETDFPNVARRFLIVGTGRRSSELQSREAWRYVGTVQMMARRPMEVGDKKPAFEELVPLVWHVFEEVEP